MWLFGMGSPLLCLLRTERALHAAARAHAADISKRAVYHGASFAASSFANNGAEWASGFFLGSSLCLLCTAATHRAPRREPLGAPRAPPAGAHALAWARVGRAVRVWLGVCGGALCVVAVVAALLVGLTWDNAPGGEGDEDTEDAKVLAILGALLVLVICLQLAAARMNQRWVHSAEVQRKSAAGEDLAPTPGGSL